MGEPHPLPVCFNYDANGREGKWPGKTVVSQSQTGAKRELFFIDGKPIPMSHVRPSGCCPIG